MDDNTEKLLIDINNINQDASNLQQEPKVDSSESHPARKSLDEGNY
jgi:hypothetical protein